MNFSASGHDKGELNSVTEYLKREVYKAVARNICTIIHFVSKMMQHLATELIKGTINDDIVELSTRGHVNEFLNLKVNA